MWKLSGISFENQKLMVGKVTTVQKVVGAVVGLVVMGSLGSALFYFFPTASSQGYIPFQPIPFSHKLHAGEKNIDCRYCHVGVDDSKHATVPAMNVCMNCHSVVKTDSPHIQKLHKAFKAGEPIEWIRVHELSDFVVFTHKRHVGAGVSCETCHGDVKSMERIEQVAPLTMGWCLDCHRGKTTPTEVLSKIHPTLEDPRGHPVAPTACTVCHN